MTFIHTKKAKEPRSFSLDHYFIWTKLEQVQGETVSLFKRQIACALIWYKVQLQPELINPSPIQVRFFLVHSLKILYFRVITDKIPLFMFRPKAKRSLSSICSYFWPISYVFYGLLEQIKSSNESYNSLTMPGGSNQVNITVV